MTPFENSRMASADDHASFHDLLAARSRQHDAIRKQGSNPIVARWARFRSMDPGPRRILVASAAVTAVGGCVLGLGLILLWKGGSPLGRPAIVSAIGLAILAVPPLARQVARLRAAWAPRASRA